MSGTPIHLEHNESHWLLDTPELASLGSDGATGLARYPAYDPLKTELARLHGVDPAMITLTPGSDAAIALICEWCARAGKRVLLPVPTFYGYERILARHDVSAELVLHEALSDSFRFPTEEIIARIAARSCDLVFLCQPNNPLGLLIPEADMARLIAAAQSASVRLVIDEAYADFENPSHVREAGETVAILRTFSKGWGLAGARIGYCVSDRTFTQALCALQLPWPVAAHSVAAARAALAHGDLIARRRALLIAARDELAAALAAIPGMATYPSRANFLLVRVPDAARVVEALAAEGIFVRAGPTLATDPSARALLSDHIRLGVPSPSERDRVLDAFVRIVGHP